MPAWTRAGSGRWATVSSGPVADNATPEGRARNRRIAITILSEELAGADTAPAAAPKSPALPGSPAAATNSLSDPSAGANPADATDPATK